VSTFEDRAVADLKFIVGGVENLHSRIDDIEKRLNRPAFGGSLVNNRAYDEQRNALAEFVRTGNDQRLNSLSIDDDAAGGFLVHPELAKQIRMKLTNASPIRQLARVIEIGSGDSFVEPVDMSDAEAGWVSERQSRPETSAGDLKQTTTPLDELYANVVATQRLLDDSQFDVGAWIINKVTRKFADMEDAAFVAGNQPHRPKGFLAYDLASEGDNTRAYGKYQYIPSGATTTLTADSLIDLVYALRAPYRANATILMNSDTGRIVRLMKDGNGSYLVVPGLALDQPDRLCGIRVVYDENMPNVVAGSCPVVIADWQRAYNIVERPGIKWLRDPYSNKPNVNFYCYRRVGAGASGDFDALKVLRIGTS
jgi:HK97 family phage major capsid protein